MISDALVHARVLLRAQATRGRLAAAAVLALFPLFLNLVSHASGDGGDPELLSTATLGVCVPVLSVLFGTAAFGDLKDDRTLVYLWLRPGSRWPLAIGAVLASFALTVPPSVVAAAAALAPAGADAGDLAVGVAGTLGAAMALTALATLAGVLLKRSLLWGIVYVFAFEGVIVGLFTGASRVSVTANARSVMAARFAWLEGNAAPFSWQAGTIGLVVITVLCIAASRFALDRLDVA